MRQSRKIVIPNDFSARPMLLLRRIMKSHPNINFDIMLLHGVYPPEGLGNLLFFSKMEILKRLEKKSYLKEYSRFKSKFKSRITAIHSDIITSTSSYALNLFLKASEVEEVFVPEGLSFKFSGRDSYDIIPLLSKSNVPVKTVSFDGVQEVTLQKSSRPSFKFDLSKYLINSI